MFQGKSVIFVMFELRPRCNFISLHYTQISQSIRSTGVKIFKWNVTKRINMCVLSQQEIIRYFIMEINFV
jgi:hypothetical protein